MGKRHLCRQEGCRTLALQGAIFCRDHLGLKRQCKATKPGSDGTIRCKKAAMVGLEVCATHGGSRKAAYAQHERAVGMLEMARFTRPYEGDLNPVSAFEMEFRRTLGRIAWLEERIADLSAPEDLIWGQTKQERIGAGEFTGTNTTNEARIHGFEEMLRWERTHLLNMEKVWISAGLENARLDLMRTYVEQTYELTRQALVALGHDVHDPRVREVMAQVFNVAPATQMLELPSGGLS